MRAYTVETTIFLHVQSILIVGIRAGWCPDWKSWRDN